MELEKALAIIFNTKDIENIEDILSCGDLGNTQPITPANRNELK